MAISPRAAAADIPSHVAADRIFDFDFLGDDRLADDMHEGFRRLSSEAPELFFTPRNGGHWVAQGRDVVTDILRDPSLFSSAAQTADRRAQTVRLPIGLDPPDHKIYRRVLDQAFSPRSMTALGPEIRALAIDLIDTVASDGGCDFVSVVAEPLPVLIFMRMAGLPEDRFHEFREWVLAAVASYDAAERQAVFDKVLDMTAPLVRERMKKPGDDLISRIAKADLDGRQPTFDEIQSFYLMLFIAGLDTVVNAMAFAIRHLAMDDELQRTLRGDPSKITAAVEEILRRFSIALPGRQLSRDACYRGIDMRHGDAVMLLLPAAGIDANAHDDPTRVDLERGASHIAFGAGIHRCVGAHLARVELKILYEEWLARIPPFRLDPDRPWRFHPALVLSVDELPLIWNERPAP